MNHVTPQSRAAFTLLEVLLAIVLIGAILGGAWAMIDYVGASRQSIRTLQNATRQRDVLLTTLERSLVGAMARDPAGGARFSGGVDSLKIPTRVNGAGTNGGVAKLLSLTFDPEQKAILAAWDAQTPEPILSGYEWCEFSYFDRDADFGSSVNGSLPRAVKIAAGRSGDASSGDPDYVLILSVLDGGSDDSSTSDSGSDQIPESNSDMPQE